MSDTNLEENKGIGYEQKQKLNELKKRKKISTTFILTYTQIAKHALKRSNDVPENVYMLL
jgi:hypothetical protein